MRAVAEEDEMLDSDPLGQRLARAEVPPISDHLRVSHLAGAHLVRRRHGHRHVAVAGTVGLAGALALLLGMTPVAAMVDRSVLPPGLQQRLGLVAGAPVQVPAGKASSAAGAGNLAVNANRTPDEVVPSLSLAEAQKRVDFTIPTLMWLPGGMSFRGALVESPHSVFLHYGDASRRKGLNLWIKEGGPVGGPAVPLSAVQPVQVDESTAFYVHGAYADSGSGTAATWDSAADAEELTWRHNGMTYDLTSGGLQLSNSEMIGIAESVR